MDEEDGVVPRGRGVYDEEWGEEVHRCYAH